MAENENQRSSRLFDRLKTFVTLNVENIRLTIAEKAILLISALLTIIVALILGGIALLFITVGVAHVLSMWLPIWASYAIMAGVNILLLLLLLIFRRVLIVNPLSRVISRIMLS